MKSLKIAVFSFVALFATQSFAEGVEPFSYSSFQAQMQNFGSVSGNSSNFFNGGFTANGSAGDQNGFTSYSAGTNIGGVIMPQAVLNGNGNSGSHNGNGNTESVGSNAVVTNVGVNTNRSQGVASSGATTHAVTNATSMNGMSSTSFADIFANGMSVMFPNAQHVIAQP